MKKEIQSTIDYQFLYELTLSLNPSLDALSNANRFSDCLQSYFDLSLIAIWKKQEEGFQLLSSNTKSPELSLIESQLSVIDQQFAADSALIYHTSTDQKVQAFDWPTSVNSHSILYQLVDFGILYLQGANTISFSWKTLQEPVNQLATTLRSTSLIGSSSTYSHLPTAESFLLDTLQLSQIGTYFYDPIKDQINLSEQTCRIYQLAPVDHKLSLKEYLTYFMPEKEKADFLARIEKALTKQVGFEVECRLKRLNGEVFYANITLAVKTYQGKVNFLFGTVRDITRQYRYIKRLQISEANLREAQSLTKIGSFDYDLLKDKINWSPETFRIFGIAPTEEEPSYEEYMNILVHPEEQERVKKIVEKSLAEGSSFEFESKQTKADGSILYTLNIGKVILHNGKTVRLVGTTQDITERKLAEQKILESSEKYTQLFNNLYDAIVVTDAEGRMIDSNTSAQKMLGYTKQELKDLLIPDIVHPEDIERSKEYLQKLISEGYYSDYQGRILRKDGEVVYVQVNSNAIYKNGELVGSRDIVRDITELKKAEQKREELLEELELVNQELRDFAYIVSHDLKAPLRAISSLSQWLYEDHKDQLSPEGNQQLELLINRSNRMHNFIEAILEYSRIGRIKLKNEWINLCDLIVEVQDMIALPAHFKIDIPVKLPKFFGQKARLVQVFQNLIVNAIKYNDKEQGNILIEWKDLKSHLQFSVTDNGPGIKPQYHDRIFKIFQTLQSRDKIESTGIGLTIVKRIVQLYDGEIKVHSIPGESTTFEFTLKKL